MIELLDPADPAGRALALNNAHISHRPERRRPNRAE